MGRPRGNVAKGFAISYFKIVVLYFIPKGLKQNIVYLNYSHLRYVKNHITNYGKNI